ncbi:glycerophosphodiester phosphodiesterase family protein [Tellurirhabdus bombi]|uniref:glycerophosphodiester phosphodiesterase family protein n=1 Tax=Tellurirhabdus bombi TaxID=2907205 RepID=UPI001F1AFBD8|nr:glycerophosphodiester phosphodiesterase family protein [Tellurirhabdus bombi]
MKKFSIVWAVIILLAGCSPKTVRTAYRVPKNGLSQFFRYEPGKTPMISAHRGGGDIKGYPENCIESFQYLADRMPTIIECDISLTKDSVLMMMHDNSLERTTTGKGKLNEVRWEYCKTLNLEDNQGNLTKFKIPTLEEVLRWGKGKVVFTLDVKRTVPFEKVVDMIHKTGATDYAAVITYNATDAAKLHRLDPALMLSVGIMKQADYERLRELGIPDNRMIAFVGTKEANPDLYRFLHEKGISCILGTLGNLDKQAAAKGDQLYRQYAKNGADIMSTDRPLELWEAVKETK